MRLKVADNGNTKLNLKASNSNSVELTSAFNINVQATLQSKSATPSTSSQMILPDSGYDGLSSVSISAIPIGSATTPATTKQQSQPSISVDNSGLITANVAATSVSVTPTIVEGYVLSGTSGTIAMSANSNTSQLATQDTTTYTPTTSDQTIASGKYLTGVQTIKGDANLVASNIAQGVTIFGVTGTHQGQGTYQTKTVTTNGVVTPDSGYDALSSVTVAIPTYNGGVE